MAAIPSKFHIGSKIINADTQTDIGTILHDGSLKTVNSESLVGSGDIVISGGLSDATLIGSTTSTATFNTNMTQYKYVIFRTRVSGFFNSFITPYDTYSNAQYFSWGAGTFSTPTFAITSSSVAITANTSSSEIFIYGVK